MDYVNLKIHRATYHELLKAKGMAEAQTGRRWTMDDVINGFLEQSPIVMARLSQKVKSPSS